MAASTSPPPTAERRTVPTAVKVAREHVELQSVTTRLEDRASPFLEFLTGVQQRVPLVTFDPRQEQALDAATTRLPVAQESRRVDACVVDNQQVTRLQQRW